MWGADCGVQQGYCKGIARLLHGCRQFWVSSLHVLLYLNGTVFPLLSPMVIITIIITNIIIRFGVLQKIWIYLQRFRGHYGGGSDAISRIMGPKRRKSSTCGL
jgi:hypothetical protein